jgi:hypothetical protein
MFCPKHPATKMAMVCGEPACGMCFAERMEVEKLAAPKLPPAKPFPPKHAPGLPPGFTRRDFERLSNEVRRLSGMPPLFPE